MTNQEKRLAVLGAIGTAMGFGVSLFSGWVSEKKLDILVSEKVQEEFKKQSAKMNKC